MSLSLTTHGCPLLIGQEASVNKRACPMLFPFATFSKPKEATTMRMKSCCSSKSKTAASMLCWMRFEGHSTVKPSTKCQTVINDTRLECSIQSMQIDIIIIIIRDGNINCNYQSPSITHGSRRLSPLHLS